MNRARAIIEDLRRKRPTESLFVTEDLFNEAFGDQLLVDAKRRLAEMRENGSYPGPSACADVGGMRIRPRSEIEEVEILPSGA